jgi:hypothetical protein
VAAVAAAMRLDECSALHAVAATVLSMATAVPIELAALYSPLWWALNAAGYVFFLYGASFVTAGVIATYRLAHSRAQAAALAKARTKATRRSIAEDSDIVPPDLIAKHRAAGPGLVLRKPMCSRIPSPSPPLFLPYLTCFSLPPNVTEASATISELVVHVLNQHSRQACR